MKRDIPENIIEKIETRAGPMILRSDGIVESINEFDPIITLDIAHELIAACKTLARGQKVPVLVDTRGRKPISREVRIYFASEEVAQYNAALAFVVDSGISAITANLFISFSPMIRPVRMFSTKREAVEWLRTFVNAPSILSSDTNEIVHAAFKGTDDTVNESVDNLREPSSFPVKVQLAIFSAANLSVAIVAFSVFVALLSFGSPNDALTWGALSYSIVSIVIFLLRGKINPLSVLFNTYIFLWIAFTTFMTAFSDGLPGPMACIFVPVPLVALIFTNLRTSLLWTMTTILIYLILYLSAPLPISDDASHLIFLSAATLCVFLCGLVFRLNFEKLYIGINRTIHRATSVLLKYAGQDFSAKIPVESVEQPFQALAYGINALGEELSDMLSRLEHHQRDLEQQVEQRTEKLKHTQSQLIQSAKFAALGEMSAGVAHEINNPVAIIHTRCRQIKKLAENQPPDVSKIVEFAEIINDCTRRIATIVKGLRDFARDTKGDPMSDYSLKSIVTDTLSLCSERLRNGGVELRRDEIPESATIECRSGEIVQILLNLLNNAHDAIKELDKKWIALGFSENDEEVIITVTDSGNGIPVNIRDKILQPFFTTKPVGKGTGLGLSISVGMAKAHNGSVTLDSDCPNTRFVLKLPKRQKPQRKVA